MNMLHTDRSKVRRRAATALLALIALLVPGPASAVGEEPSTYILLLLDTQEQMNMVPTTGLLPSCPTEKSPWISTQEALAG
ncbi:MAG: hypothetical protein FJ125_13300, partial [Deltaproteobacteria bacterium]|nr:hypothetical protein [Deltaproteobacteria bacterium]